MNHACLDSLDRTYADLWCWSCKRWCKQYWCWWCVISDGNTPEPSLNPLTVTFALDGDQTIVDLLRNRKKSQTLERSFPHSIFYHAVHIIMLYISLIWGNLILCWGTVAASTYYAIIIHSVQVNVVWMIYICFINPSLGSTNSLVLTSNVPF